MLSTKNGSLQLSAGVMDYIAFGNGSRTLVMIPGLGDGLKTVRGTALPFALMYRRLARDFRVYVFSRRRELPEHVNTRELAREVSEAMEALGLSGAAVLGVSQGGMIAQWLAIDHPDKLSRLILAVTLAEPNATMREAVGGWMEMARRGDYRALMLDTAERSYSPKRLRTLRPGLRLMGNLGRPKSFQRFLTLAEACLTHDALAELPRIDCPTLVIGGCKDKIVTGEASQTIAAAIPGSRLLMVEGLGHGLYEETPDFFRQVADFAKGEVKK